MVGAWMAAGMAVSMYTASEANSAADARANAANVANTEAAERSRLAAEADAKARKEELLRRFSIKSAKVKDSSQEVFRSAAVKLTSLESQLATAYSVTDNALATKHITGRLAERLRNTQAIKGSLAKGTIIQESEAMVKDIGRKLETMTMDVESEQLDLNIDLSNAINAANNAEVRGYTYSTSTGTAGLVSAGVSGALQGYTIGKG